MPPATHHDLPPLRKILSFHFLWSSTFASGFADRLAMLAVAVMLGQGVTGGDLGEHVRLGDSAIIAAINFWFFLPYVVWGPFAGWLADRLPRKWLMFVSDEARGLLILLAFTMIPSGQTGFIPGLYDHWFSLDAFGQTLAFTHAWKIWIMFFLIGLFAATFSPSRNSIIPNVVGYRYLQRANSVVLGMGVIGNLVGFPIGGFLSEEFLHGCILASAIAYLGPGLMWPFLKTPVTRHDRRKVKVHAGPLTPAIEIIHGARYVLSHRPILTLTLVSILFWSGSHVIMAAASAIAVDLYRGDIADFAMIGGAFGVGMLLGAVILGVLNARTGGEVIVTFGMFGAGVFLILLASVPSLYVGLVIALALGLFGGLLMIGINTMIQQFTADCFRGRVMSFKDLASDLGGVSISLFIWISNDDKGIIVVAYVFAALLIAAAGVGLFRFMFRGPMPNARANFVYRILRLHTQAMYRPRFIGRHHVPGDGPALLVANHTAGVDPLLIQCSMIRIVRWMMAKDMMVGALGWVWRAWQIIPVDTQNSDTKSVREAVRRLKDGEVVGIFPEGGLNRGEELTNEFRAGVGLIASRADVPIVPIYITGTPRVQTAFQSLLRFGHAVVVYGRPVTVSELLADHVEGSRHEHIANALRRRIEAMSERPPQADAMTVAKL